MQIPFGNREAVRISGRSDRADMGRSSAAPVHAPPQFFTSADSARLEGVCFHTDLQVRILKRLCRVRADATPDAA